MEESPELKWPHVSLIEHQGRKIYLIGTAHVSPASVQEVREVIETIKPDTVCIELCKSRFESMMDEERFKKLDIFKVIKDQKVLFVLANLALSSYQKRMGDAMGVKPGAEQLEAVSAAEKIGAELVLADRDIQATLKRTWHNLGFWKKMQVLGGLLESFLSKPEPMTEEDLEALKDRDQISDMMAELAKEMPQIKVPLIDERDRYLMSAIEAAPGQTIVAVVGAGHVAGMKTYLGVETDREALSVIPPARLGWKIVGWSIPVILLALFYMGYHEHQGEGLMKMILTWIIATGGLSAVMSAVALAHPLTILCAVLAAPITTLHPVLGVGMFTGLVEAWMRRPTVEDAERIPEDATSLKGFYKNPFLHVLLVFFLSSVGAATGTWIGGAFLVGQL